MVGVLKVRTAVGPDVWTLAGGGSIAPVWIGTSAPTDSNYKLWYDTDEPSSSSPPLYGLESAKPTTPTTPTRYFATDTKRDWLWDGTGWIIMGEPPVTWTPTFTANLTLGAGSSVGNYRRSDGYIDIRGLFTFGAGTTITAGVLSLNLPIPFAEILINQLTVAFTDGSTYYGGFVGNQVQPGFYATSASGAYSTLAVLTATVPFTWASGHQIHFSGRYRMNSRYS